MKKKRISDKHSYQMQFHETRRCKHCGREFDTQVTFSFDRRGYAGTLFECPQCRSPFDYTVIASDFDACVRDLYEGIKDRDEGEMLSDNVSVKQARRILKLFMPRE